ncbi:MAG: phosphoribosylglycinamide formyltransferase [Clostridia bacterium]|nr:phosphoribosylglycinamide formyltransferase [Clostridia bacterium]
MSKKVSIGVLVSGGGTNLQALIDAQSSGILKSGEIKLVISNNKDAFALTRAEKVGIKTAVVDKNGDTPFEEQIISLLEDNEIEIIVLAGFMCILSEKFVKKYDKKIINVHPSLIPSFCGKGFYGLRVHKAALDYGVKVTGATVHFVNEIPDGGEIIMQKSVEIEENDTPEILQKRVMEQAEWKILPLSVEKVCKSIGKGE